jgi:hypothetical protein
MTQTIKKYFVLALLSSLAVPSIVVFFTGRDDSGLDTFRSGNGWGYSVSANNKVIIMQPFIPALEGKKPFATRKEARKAGKLVIKKLEKGDEPSLTADELKMAGIET